MFRQYVREFFFRVFARVKSTFQLDPNWIQGYDNRTNNVAADSLTGLGTEFSLLKGDGNSFCNDQLRCKAPNNQVKYM